MSHQYLPPQPSGPGGPPSTAPVAQQRAEVRQAFMTHVYLHVLLAIVGFVGIELLLFYSGLAELFHGFVRGTSWLLILGGFMVVSWMAGGLARRALSPAAAYGGLALLVAANAVIFSVPLYLANEVAPGAISTAAWLSLLAFAGLSAIAMTTSRDFSFLRGILLWGGVLALVLIVGATIFGAVLGTWFAVAMIGLAGGSILYRTQQIYRSYPPGTEVVAAMSLFSSLALLFWYVLQLVMRR